MKCEYLTPTEEQNQRFGPKGQCTLLPPLPYTTVIRGGVAHQWGVALSMGGWHIPGGRGFDFGPYLVDGQ